MNNKKTKDAVELIDRWYGGDAEWDQLVAEEELKAKVGQVVYDLRSSAKLSQAELAKLIGTSQSVISKVENADYNGSALEMLARICFALHRRIDVSCPQEAPCSVVVASA